MQKSWLERAGQEEAVQRPRGAGEACMRKGQATRTAGVGRGREAAALRGGTDCLSEGGLGVAGSWETQVLPLCEMEVTEG